MPCMADAMASSSSVCFRLSHCGLADGHLAFGPHRLPVRLNIAQQFSFKTVMTCSSRRNRYRKCLVWQNDGSLENPDCTLHVSRSNNVIFPLQKYAICLDILNSSEFTRFDDENVGELGPLYFSSHYWKSLLSMTDGRNAFCRSQNLLGQLATGLSGNFTKANHFGLGTAALLAFLAGLSAAEPAIGALISPDSEVAASTLNSASGLQSGFASAFLLILFSEIGDKTFFIAAILASQKSSLTVFIGTFGALTVMTVISVFLGRLFHYADEAFPLSLGNSQLPLDDIAAVILLVYFGVSTLLEATSLESSKAEEEQQEAQLAIASVGKDGAGSLSSTASTVAAVFALVFVAEWGDKSFFSTIALSAASSPIGVVLGAVAGHGAATMLAVLGGSILSSYVSEKAIAYTGGVLFLMFALITIGEIISKV